MSTAAPSLSTSGFEVPGPAKSDLLAMNARRFPLVGLVVAAVLITPARAPADIGITGQTPRSAFPGQTVEVDLGCGWPRGCPHAIPMSLIAAGKAPEPRSCGELERKGLGPDLPKNALCSPMTRRPPRRRPYVFLGRATKVEQTQYAERYELRFQVPHLRPGSYAFVAFVPFRRPRGWGSLDSSVPSKKPLLVRPERHSLGPDSSDSLSSWLIVAAGVVAILAAGIVLRRRRPGIKHAQAP
jgi:hypothetical protein